jgi:hypothetical protein
MALCDFVTHINELGAITADETEKKEDKQTKYL